MYKYVYIVYTYNVAFNFDSTRFNSISLINSFRFDDSIQFGAPMPTRAAPRSHISDIPT